jgi:hypothetical protein
VRISLSPDPGKSPYWQAGSRLEIGSPAIGFGLRWHGLTGTRDLWSVFLRILREGEGGAKVKYPSYVDF